MKNTVIKTKENMVIKGVKIIKNGKTSVSAYDLTVENGTLATITPAEFSNKYVAAGYVDVHTHGAMGVDFSSVDETSLQKACDYYRSKGVTHFCPTFVATPLPILEKQLERLFSFSSHNSEMLRAHIEGPFISLAHKGAQPAENVQTEFDLRDTEFFKKNRDKIGVVTLCPATKNSVQLVRCLTENGIKAQGGHDDSNIVNIRECMREGLDGVTHIYCGCSTSVRDKNFDKLLGLTECGLLYDDLTVEVIADDKHISRELFEFILKCKTYKRIILVSDSLSCAGMPAGTYKLGTHDVYTDGKVCYLADMSSLAGSVTSVGEMVKILISYGIPLAEAVYQATESPRNYLGIQEVKFTVGERADYNVLDENGNVIETVFSC